jgi:hypothetical protein
MAGALSRIIRNEVERRTGHGRSVQELGKSLIRDAERPNVALKAKIALEALWGARDGERSGPALPGTSESNVGRITSDGGVMVLAQAERRLAIAEKLAAVIAAAWL